MPSPNRHTDFQSFLEHCIRVIGGTHEPEPLSVDDFDKIQYDDDATRIARGITAASVRTGLFLEKMKPVFAGLAAVALVALLPYLWGRFQKSRPPAVARNPSVNTDVAAKVAQELANGMKVPEMKSELNAMNDAPVYQPPAYQPPAYVPPPVYTPRQNYYSSPSSGVNPWTGGARRQNGAPNWRNQAVLIRDPWSETLDAYSDRLQRQSSQLPPDEDSRDNRNIGVNR